MCNTTRPKIVIEALKEQIHHSRIHLQHNHTQHRHSVSQRRDRRPRPHLQQNHTQHRHWSSQRTDTPFQAPSATQPHGASSLKLSKNRYAIPGPICSTTALNVIIEALKEQMHQSTHHLQQNHTQQRHVSCQRTDTPPKTRSATQPESTSSLTGCMRTRRKWNGLHARETYRICICPPPPLSLQFIVNALGF